MIPIGIFDLASPMSAPPWAKFGMLKDSQPERFREAAEFSEATGFRWVLWCENVAIDGESNRARFEATRVLAQNAGLLPYVSSVCVGEEWYPYLIAGLLSQPWDGSYTQIVTVRDWLGRQHGDLRDVFQVPVVWIENFVNNDRSFGAWYWRPVPPHTDIVAIQAYQGSAETFDAHVRPFLEHALTTTDKPLVVIEQWFRSPGHAWWERGPTTDLIEGVRAWRARAGSRLAARWIYSWPTRANGQIGLVDMPEFHEAVTQ